MLSKEDIDVLDTYFKSLQSIPEELDVIAQKIDKMNTINKANDELIVLMHNNVGEN